MINHLKAIVIIFNFIDIVTVKSTLGDLIAENDTLVCLYITYRTPQRKQIDHGLRIYQLMKRQKVYTKWEYFIIPVELIYVLSQYDEGDLISMICVDG